MFKFTIVAALVLFSAPLAFADCGMAKTEDSAKMITLNQILDSFEGCANIGGNCNASVPCCGDASCVRGRCQYIPEALAAALK